MINQSGITFRDNNDLFRSTLSPLLGSATVVGTAALLPKSELNKVLAAISRTKSFDDGLHQSGTIWIHSDGKQYRWNINHFSDSSRTTAATSDIGGHRQLLVGYAKEVSILE